MFRFGKIPQVVGESGLFTPADIAYVQEAGVKAVSILFFPVLSLSLCDVNFVASTGTGRRIAGQAEGPVCGNKPTLW